MNLLEVVDSGFLQKNAAMKEDITQDVQAIHMYSHDLWYYASRVTQTALHFAHTNLCMASSVLKESITSNAEMAELVQPNLLNVFAGSGVLAEVQTFAKKECDIFH